MAGKNLEFTKNLIAALKEKGIDYKPNAKTGLKKFANNNDIVYTTLHKCLRDEWAGHVPEWDQLLKISIAVNKSIDWLLTGKRPENKTCDVGCDKHIMELCKKVKAVVESRTHWGASLEANIHSFKAGLDGDEERDKMKEDMTELKKSIRGSLSDMGQKQRGEKKKAQI